MHHGTTSHDRLQAVLDLAGVELRASAIHGMVCGEICRRSGWTGEPGGRGIAAGDFPRLLGVSDPEEGTGRAVFDVVEELMEQSRRDLDAGLQFSLLLPGEDEAIEERTESLADWARGFALALLRDEELALGEIGGDSAEVVRDFLKISEAQPTEAWEEDEKALMEIEEYMRVGVQLVYEEMQPQQRPDETGLSVH